MSDPVELEDNFVLTISDQGVATPTAHAASHAALGSDPLTLTLAQISNAGTIASQAANSVAITGGSVTGVTFSSSAATITGGTISGVTFSSAAATLTGGTINNVAIGGSTAAAGRFTTGTFTSNVTVAGTLAVTGALTLTVQLAVNQGGTGATTEAGARTNLGLGVMATQSNLSVNIDGGAIDGTIIGGSSAAAGTFTNITVTGTVTLTTALPIAQGGTGATSDSAARTALGLVIGTNVQAYDADLAAIAGLTSAADKVPYFTGSGTAAVADLTATGRSITGAASVAALRTTLEVRSGSGTLVGGQVVLNITGVTASSIAVACHSGVIVSGFGMLRVRSGIPANGQVTVTSYDAAGAQLAGDVNDIHVIAVG